MTLITLILSKGKAVAPLPVSLLRLLKDTFVTELMSP